MESADTTSVAVGLPRRGGRRDSRGTSYLATLADDDGGMFSYLVYARGSRAAKEQASEAAAAQNTRLVEVRRVKMHDEHVYWRTFVLTLFVLLTALATAVLFFVVAR